LDEGEKMLKKDKFKQMLAEIDRIKRVADRESGESYWEVYDNAGTLLGYAFYLEVPETPPATEDAAEFDKYEVWGITGLDLKVSALEITPHPAGPEKLWAEGIVEPEFAKQFVGLGCEEIRLSPEWKIDAITDGTISSKLVTEAIRKQIDFIRSRTSGA